MNTQVFVVNEYDPAHSGFSGDLAFGQLGVFAYDMNDMRVKNAAAVAETEKMFLAIGRKKDGAEIGRDINIPVKAKNFKMQYFPYRAPVKQVSRVSVEGFGENDFDEFSLTINSRFGLDYSGIEPTVRTYSVFGAYEDAISLYQALVAKILLDPEQVRMVEPTATTAGLELKSLYNSGIFEAFINFIPYEDGCTRNCRNYKPCSKTLVESEDGSGYPEWVKWTAYRHAVWKGTPFKESIFLTDPSRDLVLTSAENNVWQIKWSDLDQPDDSHSDVFNVWQEILLIVPTDIDISRAVDNIEVLIGKKFRQSAVL